MKIRAIVVVQPCPCFHISERTATYHRLRGSPSTVLMATAWR